MEAAPYINLGGFVDKLLRRSTTAHVGAADVSFVGIVIPLTGGGVGMGFIGLRVIVGEVTQLTRDKLRRIDGQRRLRGLI